MQAPGVRQYFSSALAQGNDARPTSSAPHTFDIVLDPGKTCRLFMPGAAWAVDAYVKADPDRAEWQESAQARITDPVGYYKADHGHKNSRKMGTQPGAPASVGTLTCMTSTNQVAFQVDCQGMSYADFTPAVLELQRRIDVAGGQVRQPGLLFIGMHACGKHVPAVQVQIVNVPTETISIPVQPYKLMQD